MGVLLTILYLVCCLIAYGHIDDHDYYDRPWCLLGPLYVIGWLIIYFVTGLLALMDRVFD